MILVQLAGLTVWVQGSEVNLEGIEKAKEAMNKQQALAELADLAHSAAKTGNLSKLNLVAEFAPERINETNIFGWTPLHVAAQYDQEAAVSLLLSAKSDVNKTNRGMTPLHCGNSDRVKQLLRDAGGH